MTLQLDRPKDSAAPADSLRHRARRMPALLLNLVGVGVVAILVYLVAGLAGPYENFQLATACAVFCAAAGLTVLTGLTGQVSLGHGALMAIGAYTVALTTSPLTEAGLDPVLRLIVGLVLGVVASAAAGWLLGLAAARLSGPYLAGVTLALVVAVPAVATVFAGVLKGENGIAVSGVPVPPGLGAAVSMERWQLAYALIAAALVAVFLANLVRSRVGREWRAGKNDEVAAGLAGVPVSRLRVLAFVVSAGCAGLGGGLLAVLSNQASPGAFGLALSIQLLTAIVVGGLGSLIGAALGSLVVVWLPGILATVISGWSLSPSVGQRLEGNLPLAVYGAVLILVMLVAPHGLAGTSRRIGGLFARGRRRQTGTPADR